MGSWTRQQGFPVLIVNASGARTRVLKFLGEDHLPGIDRIALNTYILYTLFMAIVIVVFAGEEVTFSCRSGGF